MAGLCAALTCHINDLVGIVFAVPEGFDPCTGATSEADAGPHSAAANDYGAAARRSDAHVEESRTRGLYRLLRGVCRHGQQA